MALGTVALRSFGVGGYRGGFWICLAALVVVPTLTLGTASRSERRSALLYLGASALLAATAASWLVAESPPSAGRLSDRLDALDLPFYEVVDERRTGSSTCRPTCPAVVRTYRGPATGVRAAIVNTAVALDAEGLLGPPGLRRTFTEAPLSERVDGLRVRVDADRDEGPIRLVIRLAVAEGD